MTIIAHSRKSVDELLQRKELFSEATKETVAHFKSLPADRTEISENIFQNLKEKLKESPEADRAEQEPHMNKLVLLSPFAHKILQSSEMANLNLAQRAAPLCCTEADNTPQTFWDAMEEIIEGGELQGLPKLEPEETSSFVRERMWGKRTARKAKKKCSKGQRHQSSENRKATPAQQ
jgi:hypothetical protein